MDFAVLHQASESVGLCKKILALIKIKCIILALCLHYLYQIQRDIGGG